MTTPRTSRASGEEEASRPLSGGGSNAPPPLDGVVIVDFSHTLPGPYCTQLLADLGATVTKIERPSGDYLRTLMPDVFAHYNRGKKSVVLDLREATDQDEARRLVMEADVVVEGFRPGVMAKFGLDAESIRSAKPSLIYCSISGWGQDSDLRELPGHDLNYLGAAGGLHDPVTGDIGESPTLLVADLASGAVAAAAITAAIVRKNQTGVGATIDLAMADIALSWAAASHIKTALGNGHQPDASPSHGVFYAKDGVAITLGAIEDHFWDRFAETAGDPRLLDPRFATHVGRTAAHAEVKEILRQVIATETADEWIARARTANFPIFRVATFAEALESPHFLSRGIVQRTGNGVVSGFPSLWDGQTYTAGQKAPLLGEDNSD